MAQDHHVALLGAGHFIGVGFGPGTTGKSGEQRSVQVVDAGSEGREGNQEPLGLGELEANQTRASR